VDRAKTKRHEGAGHAAFSRLQRWVDLGGLIQRVSLTIG
jgi:hypothetical protein